MAKWQASDIPDLTGKRALITGGNSGIGYYTALELARHGATVVIAARNPGRAETARHALRGEVHGAIIELATVDLASLTSVRELADSIIASGPLDILVNDAGVMAVPTRQLTIDGFELQFGTNHLGHFALTLHLLPALRQTPVPIVVTVASLAHRRATMDFTNLQGERRYSPWEAYSRSKLANLMFAQELPRRVPGLRSHPVHPGVSFTNIVQGGPRLSASRFAASWRVDLMQLGFRLIGQPASRGALPSLQAATMAGLPNGLYIGPDGPREMFGAPAPAWMTAEAADPIKAGRLWEVSEALTGVRA